MHPKPEETNSPKIFTNFPHLKLPTPVALHSPLTVNLSPSSTSGYVTRGPSRICAGRVSEGYMQGFQRQSTAGRTLLPHCDTRTPGTRKKLGKRNVLLLMVQKSGKNQLRLVAYPIIYRVFYIPGGCLGFLNHQQFLKNFKSMEIHW